ncbi:P2X purinoceptor 7-like isoform X2 [Strigops habroptila]|uniref:P2X purinoceptor 7-like isoform X2 n=1 Tax=Strigops habroptila TaxID=2489341 RepID=UPI0011D017A6|nr:P2X purinoceptor 7-like isoform X2 [Strigops habroptila]
MSRARSDRTGPDRTLPVEGGSSRSPPLLLACFTVPRSPLPPEGSCIVIACRFYQETGDINSSVCSSAKGVAYTEDRIWDSAEYTNAGIPSGRCVNYNDTVKSCKVRAWCPVESLENPPGTAVLRSSEDFIVLTKNNIHFPNFNYTVLNIPPNLNSSCTYNKMSSSLCPVFHLGDTLQEAKEEFSEVAVKAVALSLL